VDEAVQLARKI